MSNETVERTEQVRFKIYKFTDRPNPSDPDKTKIVCCFSEFGCETLGVLYVFDRLKRDVLKDNYVIAVGWYGREYFYRHLVDEFWEINEEHMWLRDFCKAFHHESKNLKKLEEVLGRYGEVIHSARLGHYCVGHQCRECGYLWGTNDKPPECKKCGRRDIEYSILSDVNYWKNKANRLPSPSVAMMEKAKSYLKGKSVAVCARGRSTYGRNLPPDFYVGLVKVLEKKGYTPIWIGEKQSSQACPVDHIVDLSRLPESRDLEFTLAIVMQCEFTVQFWTASSRLAGMMGVPYLLFESPDQLWGRGQEGTRLELMTFGNKKVAVNHFVNVLNNPEASLDLVEKCISEMESENWNDVIGLVDSSEIVNIMRDGFKSKVGR